MPLLESCFFKSLNWYLFSATNDSQWHRLKFRSFVTWSYTYYYKYTLKIYRPILSTFALTDYFTAGRKNFLIKKKKKRFRLDKSSSKYRVYFLAGHDFVLFLTVAYWTCWTVFVSTELFVCRRQLGETLGQVRHHDFAPRGSGGAGSLSTAEGFQF